MKMRESGDNADHPLKQKAGEGFVWRWMPYSPGGPPLKSEGEFSVPIDQGEVDAILNAAEAGQAVPVFKAKAKEVDDASKAAAFASKKDEGNSFFKAGKFIEALKAYDAAVALGSPKDADVAVAHSNAAQALLKLAENDVPRREACAAEALRRGLTATQLDPTNSKAYARCATACDILGEDEAAKEFRARLEGCAAADAESKAARQREAMQKKKELEERKAAKEAREALLERERALERQHQDQEAVKKKDAVAASLNAMLGIDASIAGFAGGYKDDKQMTPGASSIFVDSKVV
eukprot:TRINITY_DN29093_c0_g1_i1.p1 TRINITY_DN29093_c0_g1~~TRINITY_DN29093_c0_g1_i1.p1  ORF type:complete len:293 (-),score=99.65 TRINITY_DN29093_c0_g1_i1:80-958(-)